MRIKKMVSTLLMGCVLSFGLTNVSIAKTPAKSSKVQKAKSSESPTRKVSSVRNVSRNSGKASERRKRVKSVLGGAVLAGGVGAVAASIHKPKSSSLIYSLMDLNTGEYLEANNTKSVHSLASLTKLMTAYVFMHSHPDWKNCEITITDEDKDELKNTKTRVARNQPHSCEDVLQAVLVMSDNWAAASLSRNVPGLSEGEFIRRMNKQARMWGMKDTVFADPAGVNPYNKSTAQDLNILISQINQEGNMKEISTMKDVVIRGVNGQMKTFHNTNMLVRESFFGSSLSKTGYINESGYNLVFVPQFCAEGRHLALVIMGASSSMNRASFARNILNKYNCV